MASHGEHDARTRSEKDQSRRGGDRQHGASVDSTRSRRVLKSVPNIEGADFLLWCSVGEADWICLLGTGEAGGGLGGVGIMVNGGKLGWGIKGRGGSVLASTRVEIAALVL